MDKKEYITNQFRKSFGKKYENYCITRIYSLLNRLDVQIITQQLFKRENGKIALADLYFPQIKLIVEVDEWQHQKEWNKKDDMDRSEAIKKEIKSLSDILAFEPEVLRIDVTKSIEEINARIDEIVDIINDRIKQLGEQFKPWTNKNENTQYYINKKNISVEDKVQFRTVQEVSELFNKGYKASQKVYFKTGFENEHVCCPKLQLEESEQNEFKNNPYINTITSDKEYIFEYRVIDPIGFVNDMLKYHMGEVRIMFPKYKDETGIMMYRFRGIYIFDINATKETLKSGHNRVVWKKIDNKLDLSKYFKK